MSDFFVANFEIRKIQRPIQICGVSLAWVGDADQWISCKELKDRRLHHVDDVEKRAHDLNLRLRHSNPDEHYLFRKMGAGARSACKEWVFTVDTENTVHFRCYI